MFILNLILPFLLTYFITRIALPYFKKYISAAPTQRGLHNYSKPSGGGIIFSLICLIFSANNNFFYLALISMPLSIIGLIDDRFNISSKYRLIVQLFTVILIISYLKNNEINFLNTFIDNNILINFIFIFLGLAIINFINFMDGIDGLVSGSFIIVLLLTNSESNYLFPLIGSLIGFLFFNWQPSKIFMGDSGSLFLGSIFVGIIFKSNTNVQFLEILLLSTPLIIDPLITLIRRVYNKQSFWEPHKLHLYQRLVSAGLSHSTVSSIYIASILLLGIVYKFSNLINLIIFSGFVVILGLFLDYKFAINFNERK